MCTKLSELGQTKEATDTKYYEIIVDEYVYWVNKDTQEIVSKGKDSQEDATKVTASNIQIKKGKTVSIAVTIEPAGASTRNVTYKSSNESIATVSNGTITGISTGKATITIKTKNGHEEIFEVTVTEVGMTIAEAKAAVQRDGLQAHIGDLVEYNPTAGGKWRIFYYDEAGEFGTAGKLYLKRDFDSSLTKSLSVSGTYTNTSEAIIKMKAMNPKWAESTNSSSIDLNNEKAVAWLCDPANWTNYKTAEADYAIGSPSVEMYMKAFNVWKDNNKDSTTLICKIGSQYGYSVGAKNSYTWNGSNEYGTGNNSIEAGPNNIFMTAGENYWWLASPSSYDSPRVLNVRGDNTFVGYNSYGLTLGVCPVVSL